MEDGITKIFFLIEITFKYSSTALFDKRGISRDFLKNLSLNQYLMLASKDAYYAIILHHKIPKFLLLGTKDIPCMEENVHYRTQQPYAKR